MQQFQHYQQADYDYCDYAHEEDNAPEFYDQEEAMFAHIPGIPGRAAAMGDTFSSTVFGQHFGTVHPSAKPTLPTIPEPPEILPMPESHDDIFDTSFLSADGAARTCVNPFAGTNFPLQRRRNTATRIWDSCMPIIGLFHVLMRLAPTFAAPRTRSTLLTVLIVAALLITLFPTPAHTLLSPGFGNVLALATNIGATSSALQNYLIDSGCSTSIISDTKYLHNIRPCTPVHVKGITGVKTLTIRADLHLPVRTATYYNHTIILKNVLYNPDGYFNLLSTDQLN